MPVILLVRCAAVKLNKKIPPTAQTAVGESVYRYTKVQHNCIIYTLICQTQNYVREKGVFFMKKRKDGTTKFFYSSAANERAAERDINRQILNYESEEHTKKYNFLKIAKVTLEEQEKFVSNSTAEGYEYALKHLEPFYDKDIVEISPAMVQKLLDNMAKQQYSYSAISKTKIVFGLILNYAIVNNDLPLTNFMRSIKIPKNVKKGKVVSPDDEIIKAVTANVGNGGIMHRAAPW